MYFFLWQQSIAFYVLGTNILAKEVNIKAKEVLTFEKGQIIIGKEEVEAKINNEIEIYADKITYNKEKEELTAEGNVISRDLKNNIEIKSKKAIYKKKKKWNIFSRRYSF